MKLLCLSHTAELNCTHGGEQNGTPMRKTHTRELHLPVSCGCFHFRWSNWGIWLTNKKCTILVAWEEQHAEILCVGAIPLGSELLWLVCVCVCRNVCADVLGMGFNFKSR